MPTTPLRVDYPDQEYDTTGKYGPPVPEPTEDERRYGPTPGDFNAIKAAINDHADRLLPLAEHLVDDDRHAATIAGPFATWQAAQPSSSDTTFPAYIRALTAQPAADSASMTFT